MNVLIMSYSDMWHANSVTALTLVFAALLLIASILGAIIFIAWSLIISDRCNIKTVTLRSIICMILFIIGMTSMTSLRMEENAQLNNGVVNNIGCYYKIKSYNKQIKKISIKERRTYTHNGHKSIVWIQDTCHNKEMIKRQRKLLKERQPYEKAYRNPSHKYNGTNRIHLKKFHLFKI